MVQRRFTKRALISVRSNLCFCYFFKSPSDSHEERSYALRLLFIFVREKHLRKQSEVRHQKGFSTAHIISLFFVSLKGICSSLSRERNCNVVFNVSSRLLELFLVECDVRVKCKMFLWKDSNTHWDIVPLVLIYVKSPFCCLFVWCKNTTVILFAIIRSEWMRHQWCKCRDVRAQAAFWQYHGDDALLCESCSRV